MKALPSGWRWATVDEVAGSARQNVVIGPFGSHLKVSDYRSSGVRLIFVRNIRSGDFSTAATRSIDEAKAKSLRAHEARSGDVLITKMGDPPGDARVYRGPPAIVTADCIRLRPSPGFDARFIAFAFASTTVTSQIEQITRGVAQRKVSLSRFRKGVLLPVPSLEEQRNLVDLLEHHLSRLDAAKSNLNDCLSKTAQLRRSILASTLGWAVPGSPSVVGDVGVVVDCEHRTAKRAAAGDEFALSVRTTDIASGRIDTDRARRVTRETFNLFTRRAIPEAGDLVLSREAPVGQVGLIDGREPICLGQRVVLIQCRRAAIRPRFLMHALLSPPAQRWMTEHSTGTTVSHLNVADVRRIPIGCLPDLAEQDRLIGELDDAMGAIDRLVDQTRVHQLRSRALRRSLFDAAFSGRLSGVARSADRFEELAGV